MSTKTFADLTGQTILIVDDNPTNLGVISDTLRERGFRIIVARDGENGIKRAELGHPDLILLDVMMPGIDGFETCRRLKSLPATRDIPVIFMTALTETEDKVKGFDVGAVDYVTKPLQHEEVLARVTTHLSLRALTRDLQTQNAKLQQLSSELAARNVELVELNATKDKLFSIIAHDLRGPFTPIINLAQLLELSAEKSGDADMKEMAGGVYRSSKNIYNLLENLLQWAQIQRGQIKPQPEKVYLKQLITDAQWLYKDNAAAKHITVSDTIETGLWAFADEQLLETIIRNLILNAIKFTPDGGKIHIGVQLSPTQPHLVEIAITDTGVGMDAEQLKQLFKVGGTHTKGTQEEQGSGLGLIICQEMVQKNGGKIWVEKSEAGKGTTMKFTVPKA
jgi:signal transduction histidine kinase